VQPALVDALRLATALADSQETAALRELAAAAHRSSGHVREALDHVLETTEALRHA
jgi:hypothetical protein